MWKLLPSIRVLKTLRESSKGKVQREQYLLAVGLSRYKWYQSQTPGDVPARRLSPEEGGHEVVCQQGRWARRGWIGRSHIDGRRERVAVRTLGPEGGWIVRSYISWGGERNTLYKGVETSPSQTCFKNLEGNPKRESLKRTISSGGLRVLYNN